MKRGTMKLLALKEHMEYDENCPLCRRDKLQPQPYHDSVCWCTFCNSHPGFPLVVLNRHAAGPTPEELQHMKNIAEQIFPGHSWRPPAAILTHYHLHAT